MAKRLDTIVNTVVPGSYPQVIVKSDPVGVGASGIIAIIGEADGGVDHTQEDVKLNYFGASQVDKVAQKYISGPIVDAMRMLSAPSADADITGAPTRVYILKTNASVKAAATLPSYGSLEAKIAGADGNKIKYEVTATQDEVAPYVQSAAITNFAALADVEFAVRVNGGALANLDVFASGVPADFDTIAEVIALIDAGLPAGLSCVAGSIANSFKIVADADANAHQKGWGKSFEIIEVTTGGLAALGLSEVLAVSSIEPKVQVDLKKIDIIESFSAEAVIAMQVGYEGTTATMTIASGVLSTTVLGGAGADLSINLNEFATISDLAEYIASQPGYYAQALVGSTQLNPLLLDDVAAIGICTSNNFRPGRIKKAMYNFENALVSSQLVDFVASALAGLPAETAAAAFLVGGAKGATAPATIVDALDKLKGINLNMVLPLFSRDASEDIAEGLTDSGSTYTIAAINASVKNHVLAMSTSKNKKNRIAYLSFWGAFADAKAEASSLANARMSLAFQKVSQVNGQGEIVVFLPWMAAVNAAGMQAAGFYRDITNKAPNIIAYVDPSGYDSENIDDQEDAILAGLMPLTKDLASNKWLISQTTYTKDENFVYNSSQLMYVADLLALDLTASLQNAFVGQSLADVTAGTVSTFVISKCDSYRRQRLLASSSDALGGYKNLKVVIRGAIIEVSVELKPAESILFIPLTISLSQVSSEA